MTNAEIERNIRDILERDFKRVNKFDTEKGGVYVETTEDPRGWMFGDKTRRIYETTVLQIKLLTGLLIFASCNHDGKEVKASVYNPQYIKTMMLSKNDDVGSFIQYADIDVSVCAKLIANIGEHICIEPIERSWIRVAIYPGENIVGIINVDESDILKLLEDSQIYMRERLQELVGRYYRIEEDIDVAISGLRRYGESCDCGNPLVFKQIHEGDFDEIMRTCLKCGGIVCS